DDAKAKTDVAKGIQKAIQRKYGTFSPRAMSNSSKPPQNSVLQKRYRGASMSEDVPRVSGKGTTMLVATRMLNVTSAKPVSFKRLCPISRRYTARPIMTMAIVRPAAPNHTEMEESTV